MSFKKEAVRVVFRRIRGRIVPIIQKGVSASPASLFGGLLGSAVGVSIFTKADEKNFRKLKKKMAQNKVSTKSFIRKSGIKNVVAITSAKDLKRTKLFTVREKRMLRPAITLIKNGDNAFAFFPRKGRKDVIMAGKRVSEATIGHELGHIKDFRKKGTPGFFGTGLLGVLTGKTLAREKEAWRISASKSKVGKTEALRTYETSQRRARLGAATGALSAILLRKFAK